MYDFSITYHVNKMMPKLTADFILFTFNFLVFCEDC